MDVYYHIVSIEKKKKCKFNFSFVRNEKISIFGSVEVDYSLPGKEPVFDAESEAALDNREKQFITARVLRHIYTDMRK